MKWISLILQILAVRKTLTTSSAAMEYIERTSEKARDFFLFACGSVVATLFLMAGLITAILGIGLQIEKQGYVSFTGLILSASLFLVLSLITLLISLIILNVQRKQAAERQRIREQQASGGQIMPLLEATLKQIIHNFAQQKSKPETTAPENVTRESKKPPSPEPEVDSTLSKVHVD